MYLNPPNAQVFRFAQDDNPFDGFTYP